MAHADYGTHSLLLFGSLSEVADSSPEQDDGEDPALGVLVQHPEGRAAGRPGGNIKGQKHEHNTTQDSANAHNTTTQGSANAHNTTTQGSADGHIWITLN